MASNSTTSASSTLAESHRADALSTISSTGATYREDSPSPVKSEVESLKPTERTLLERSETTNSSPTDPLYVPIKTTPGNHSIRSPASPKLILRSPARRVSMVERSFFDSDTGSEDEGDEPVISRASSARMSKPNVVEQRRKDHGQKLGRFDIEQDRDSHPVAASGRPVSKASRTVAGGDDAMYEGFEPHKEPVEILNKQAAEQLGHFKPGSERPSSRVNTLEGLSDKARRGGLFMHPVNSGKETGVNRTMSAPPVPQRRASARKVQIRPLDLIAVHSPSGAHRFRETVVTTPYPVLDDIDEKVVEPDDAGDGSQATTALPQEPQVRSARSENDRFPSPDRSEVLFLDLGLARHPSMVTGLEIKIADKGTYDDEMLFRQIRAAYRSCHLGTLRAPLSLIRRVTFATISSPSVSAVHHDFKMVEFMKHFRNPRIGRKRKTWVIWLRHQSRRQSLDIPSEDGSSSGSKQPPVSAGLSNTDRRLSLQSSDSTSNTSSLLNFSLWPHLSMIGRLPFFERNAPTAAALSTSHPSPPPPPSQTSGVEKGYAVIRIELHHEFSFWVLALLHACVLVLSVAAIVLWTVFGVPGSRPGHDKAIVTDGPLPTAAPAAPATGLTDLTTWNVAAQSRVLTGLVLGMTVALLGSMLELGLVAGAYILL